MKIIVDSREQKPFIFRKSKWIEGTIVKKLDVGDYSFESNGIDYSDKISIDRKSPGDLFGTLGKGHKRFDKEIERADGFDYFGIVVEATLTEIKNKDFDFSHFIKMRGDVIISICFTLKMKYGIDVVFCNGRKDATAYVREVFKAYMKIQNDKPE